MSTIFPAKLYCHSGLNDPHPTVTIRSTADEDYLDPFISKFNGPAENVVDGLEQKAETWVPWTPVLIHAGTGCGKSTFVLKTLVPLVQQRGGRLLLVSNRLALSAQYKRQLLTMLEPERLRYLTQEGIEAEREIGCVTLCNYQGLAGFMEHLKKEGVQPFSYVILDEAHFFTADSMFARDTGWLLDKIIRTFSTAVRVYMTATPWAVQNCIAEAESPCPLPMWERAHCTINGGILQPSKALLLYKFKEPRRDYCIVCLPSEVRDQLDHPCVKDLIQKSGQEKWLIFVESKAQGRALANKFPDAKFLDREGKGTILWRTLLARGTFPCRILVTTSVLDCGVNILDSQVRHILLLTTDHTQFMQELGRKRLQPGETVTVYVPDLSARQLERLQTRNDQFYRALQEFSSADVKRRCGLRFDEWYGDERGYEDAIRHLLPIDSKGQLHVNRCAAQTIFQQQRFYEKLTESESRHPFLETVHRWLGQEDASLCWSVTDQDEKREELLTFFKSCEGKMLASKSEKERFGEEVKALCTAAFGPRKEDRPDRSAWGKAIINRVLEANELGYTLESVGQGWMLKKVGGTDREN